MTLILGASVAFSAPGALSTLKETLQADRIEKQSIILTASEAKILQKEAKAPIKSGVYRAYLAKKGKQITGGAILMIQRVRTKDMATLYVIDKNVKVKSIEILSFLEPPEYEPSQAWLKQIHGKSNSEPISIGSDINNITGATLSANAVTQGVRTALAIYRLKLHKSGRAE